MFCYQLQSDLLNLENAKMDNNLQYQRAIKISRYKGKVFLCRARKTF